MFSRLTTFRRLFRVAVTAASLAAAVVVAPTAAEATHAAFVVKINPDPNGGGTAYVSDTLVPSNKYLLTLTNAGTGTCGLTGPTVQIADTDVQGFGNPVSASVSGACALYNAAVVYTVTWTGVPGASGEFPVLCTWVVGTMECSVTTVNLALPS